MIKALKKDRCRFVSCLKRTPGGRDSKMPSGCQIEKDPLKELPLRVIAEGKDISSRRRRSN